jgi:kynurenine formamidase
MKFIIVLVLSLTFAGCESAVTKSSNAIKPADITTALRDGSLKVVDCTYTYFEGMPGIKLPPPFAQTKTYEVTNISRYDERGPAWYWNWFSVGEHAGTHIDAPKHWISGKDSNGVDRIEPAELIAPAVIIDVESSVASNQDYELSTADLQEWEKKNGRIPDGSVVIMRSGWGKRWPDPTRYLGLDDQGRPHGPGFGEDAADFLLKERNISGLAVDTVSTEAMALAGLKKPMAFPVHFKVHGAKKYQIEMMASLDALPASGAVIIISPVKVKDGSGAPARIYALVSR